MNTIEKFKQIEEIKQINNLSRELEELGFKVLPVSNFSKEDSYVLWLWTTDHKVLKLLMWAGCNRYWNWNTWELGLSLLDPDKDEQLDGFHLKYLGFDLISDVASMIKGIKKLKVDNPCVGIL